MIVRDVSGQQVTTGVTGLTVSSSDPSRVGIAPQPGMPSGYFFCMTGAAATPAGTPDEPPAGAVRLIADGTGVHAEVLVTVTP